MRLGWLFLACLACSKAKPAPAREIKLYTDAELTQIETSLMTRLTANQTRTCTAPVVHGETKPGAATPELLALVEHSGALATCSKRLTDAVGAKKLYEVAEMYEAHDPAILALAKECGPVVDAAFAAAAAHPDSCAPIQAGKRHTPEETLGIMRATYMLGLQARLRADGGDPVGGLWSLVSALRPLQDLARGHVDLVTAMETAVGYGIVYTYGTAILEKASVPADAATAMEAAVDSLLAIEPRFGSFIAGQYEHMGLYLGLAAIKPAGWEPPGGISASLRKDIPDPRTTGNPRMSRRDLGALILSSDLALLDAYNTACPETATFADCDEGINALEARMAKDAASSEILRDPFALLFKLETKDSDEVRLEIQHKIRDALAVTSKASFREYVAKRGRAVASLAALRAALEIERTGACKPVEVAVANQLLGTPIRVAADDKQVTLRWPADSGEGKDFVVHCP